MENKAVHVPQGFTVQIRNELLMARRFVIACNPPGIVFKVDLVVGAVCTLLLEGTPGTVTVSDEAIDNIKPQDGSSGSAQVIVLPPNHVRVG